MLRRIVHGGSGPGGAQPRGGFGNARLRHEAPGGALQLLKARAADAREGHIRVSDDLRAAPQGLRTGRRRAGGEAQVFRIVKIRARVDAAQDHGGVFRGEHHAARFELGADDGHAAVFDFSRPGLHRHIPP